MRVVARIAMDSDLVTTMERLGAEYGRLWAELTPDADGIIEVVAISLPPITDDPWECDHPNQSGVDKTPLDDPAKIWRCDSCGAIIRPGDLS